MVTGAASRRGGAAADRRARGRAGAVAPARLSAASAGREAGRGAGQQDGPGRLLGRPLRPGRRGLPRLSRAASASTPACIIPISAREGDNMVEHSAADALVPGPDRARRRWTPSRYKRAADRAAAAAAGAGRLQVRPAPDHRRPGRERARLEVGDEVVFSPSNKTAKIKSIEAWHVPEAPELAQAGPERSASRSTEQIFVERGEVMSHLEQRADREQRVQGAAVLARPQAAADRQAATRSSSAPLEAAGHGRGDRARDRHLRPVDPGRPSGSSATAPARSCCAPSACWRSTSIGRTRSPAGSCWSRTTCRWAAASSRWRAIPTSAQLITVRSTNITAVGHARHPRGALGAQRPQGRRALVHRPVGRRQVDPGAGARARAVRQGLPGLRAGRRQHPRRASTPISASARRTGPRTSAASARWPSLFADAGFIVISSFISPYRSDRERARAAAKDAFHEVYVKASLDACEDARPEGPLQARAQGRDPRVHRHQQPLRGARAARPGGADRRAADRRVPGRADPLRRGPLPGLSALRPRPASAATVWITSKPSNCGWPEIERLAAARVAVRRAERLRAGPGLEIGVGAPDRVRGVEHMVLALGPLEQVELDEARHAVEMAVAAEPDRLEIGLAALERPRSGSSRCTCRDPSDAVRL